MTPTSAHGNRREIPESQDSSANLDSNDFTFDSFTVINNDNFHHLLAAVITTIETFVQSDNTGANAAWDSLVDNGITQDQFATVTDISRLLQCRKTIHTIIAELSTRFPTLKSFWKCVEIDDDTVRVCKIQQAHRITRNAVYLTESPRKDDTHDNTDKNDFDEGYRIPKKTFKSGQNTTMPPTSVATINMYSRLDQDDSDEDDNIDTHLSVISRKSSVDDRGTKDHYESSVKIAPTFPKSNDDDSENKDISFSSDSQKSEKSTQGKSLNPFIMNQVKSYIATGRQNELSLDDIAQWIESDSIAWIHDLATDIVNEKLNDRFLSNLRSTRNHCSELQRQICNSITSEANAVETRIISQINTKTAAIVQPVLQHFADTAKQRELELADLQVKLDIQERQVKSLMTVFGRSTDEYRTELEQKLQTIGDAFELRCTNIVTSHLEDFRHKLPPQPTSSSAKVPTASSVKADSPSTDVLPQNSIVKFQCGMYHNTGTIQHSNVDDSGIVHYTVSVQGGLPMNIIGDNITSVVSFPAIPPKTPSQPSPSAPTPVVAPPSAPAVFNNRFNIDPATLTINAPPPSPFAQRSSPPYDSDEGSAHEFHQQASNPYYSGPSQGQTDMYLSSNQYQLKGQPRPVTINAALIISKASKWNIKLTSTAANPKPFYETLRSKLASYHVLITQWKDIRTESDIPYLTSANSRNADDANIAMSNIIFNTLLDNRKSWFKGNTYHRSLLTHYQHNNDGFGFLREVITEHHPRLRTKAKSETRDKPRLRHDSNWYTYVNKYIEWVEFESTSEANRTYTPSEHVSNILTEMEKHSQYRTAVDKLKHQMQQIDDDIIVFPKELELRHIALTVMKYIPRAIRDTLATEDSSDDDDDNINVPAQGVINHFSAHKFNNRTDRPGNRSNSTPSKPSAIRPYEDVKCKACGKWGHCITLNGCDATAISSNIADYKKVAKDDFDKKSVQELFRAHETLKREQRIANRGKRNTLRRKLRESLTHAPNAKSYGNMKQHYIKAFKKHYHAFDLHDPRESNTHEIREYDVLDSEPDSDNDDSSFE
jgi:hypothetical protein